MPIPEFESADPEPEDPSGQLPPISQSPDDLMELPIEELAFKLVTRVRRLRKIKRINGPEWLAARERQLIRVAEIACRVRVREMARWIFRELRRK